MRALVTIVLSLFFATAAVFSQTEKDKFYMQQCSKWHYNFDSLQYYGRLLIGSDHPKAVSEGFYALGYSFQKSMANDSALYYYQKAALQAHEFNDYQFVSRIIKNQAVSAGQKGDTELALKFTTQLETLGRENQDTLLLALSDNQRGIFYKDWGQYQNSVEANTRAAKIYKELNHPNLVNSYTNLALVYAEMDLDSFAHQFFNKAYRAALKYNIPRLINRAAGNLGNFYRNSNQLDSALHYFNIQLRDTARLPLRVRTILFQNLAEIKIKTGELEKANELIALLRRSISDKASVRRRIEYYQVKMRYQIALENWSEAMLFADSSLAELKQQQFYTKMLPTLSSKAMLHEKLGNYELALETLKSYNTLKDSLTLTTNVEAVEKVVAEYELNEKEEVLQMLLLEKEETSDYLKLSIFTMFVILFLGGAVIYLFKKNSKGGHSPATAPSQLQDGSENYYIQLNSGVKLLAHEVVYIKSDGHYLDYFLLQDEKPVLDRDTISSRSEELQNNGFLRIHRSHLVNEKHVRKVLKHEVELVNKLTLPISRMHRERLIENGHPLFT